MNSVEQQLLSYINGELVSRADSDVQRDTSLVDIIDSAAIMELVVWIEETFGFAVDLEDLHEDNFGSVRQLEQWIGVHATCMAK